MQKIRNAALCAFFLVCMALQPFMAQADIAPLFPEVIWEIPYQDDLTISGHYRLIGYKKTHYYNMGRKHPRYDPYFILNVPGPCAYEVVLTPDTESLSTIRHTGEKSEFGPDELYFPISIELNEGDRARYSLRAKITLYRYSKKVRDSQDFREWEGLLPVILKKDKYIYTLQDKKGKELVLEDSIEVWKKDGKVHIRSNLLPHDKVSQ